MALRTYPQLGLPTESPFQWQVATPESKAREQARRDYLRKLKSRGLTEADVLKNKATRKNLPVNLRAYTEPTNSGKAPR